MVTKIKQTGIEDEAVGGDQVAGNAITTDKVALDTLTASDLAPDSVGASEIAAGAVGAAEIDDGSITTDDLAVAARPAFTKSFESTQQTITSAGALTLAHGMGVKPKIVQVVLVCTTAELGYSINDEVLLSAGQGSGATTDRGLSIVPDATNINVRFGATAAALAILHKTTGVTNGATNASWRLVLRAYA